MADTLAADLPPSGLGLFGDIQPQVTPEVLDYLRSALASGQVGGGASASMPAQPAGPQAAPRPSTPQAQPMGPDPSAAAGVPPSDQGYTLPPYPQAPAPRSAILDIIDKNFLGGAIEHHADLQYQRQATNYQNAVGRLQFNAARDYILNNVTDPAERSYALSDPLGYMKAVEARLAPANVEGGSTRVNSGIAGRPFTAPRLFVDEPSGVAATQFINGTVPTGQFGGDITVDSSGNVISRRLGAVGSVPEFQHFPRTDTHGFVQSGTPGTPGSATAPVGGSGSPEPAQAPTGTPANAAPSDVETAIRSRASAAGLSNDDASNLVAIGKLESSLNPKARNNGSSTGLFQFHPDTFAALGGTNIKDPTQQIDAAINNYRQNGQALIDSNIDPNATSLYLAHQQGIGATRALYTADPNTSAVDAIAPLYTARYGQIRGTSLARRAIVNNGGSPNMTAGDFIAKWDGKVKGALAQNAPSAASAAVPASAAAPASASGPGALGSENLSGGATYSKPVLNPQRGQYESTGPDGQTVVVPSPEGDFNTAQAKSLSDTVDQLSSARENALQVRQGSLQAIAYAKSHPMTAATPHLVQAANALRALPPEMLQAAGIDPNKINAAANDAGVFQRIVNQNLLQAGKTMLPSRYTERELMLAKPIAGSLSTPNEAMEYTAALTGALAKRTQDQADFADGYSGPKTRQAFEKAWAESPQGQRSIFQDPEVWKGVTINGKPAVIYTHVKGQNVGVFGYGTPQQYVFRVQ